MFLRTKLTPDLAALGLARQEGPDSTIDSVGPKRLVILGSAEAALAMARDAHLHGLQPLVFDLEAGIAMRSRHVLGQCAGPLVRGGDNEALLRELRELGHPQLTDLIATSDDWLRRVMALRSHLTGSYRALLMPNNDTLAICLEKGLFAHWCREQDICTPLTWRVGLEPRPAQLQAPFLLRPALSRQGLAPQSLPKAAHAATEATLASWLERFQADNCPVVVSESLLDRPLIQYSIGFARRSARFLGFVTEKVRPAPSGCDTGTFVSLRDEPSLLALGKTVADRLDFFGIGEIEVLHDRSTGRNHVIEVNARPWLQYAMAPASGHDLLRVVSGVRAPEYPRGRSSGIHWCAPMADQLLLAHSSANGFSGRLRTAARMARALARANVYARLDWSDPWPALSIK